MANLRGGGEYGTAWRAAGSLRNKQNVFDDFQACAEKLVADGWTAPGRLAIQGGSNGGLLVAACANQRPDLYAAGKAGLGRGGKGGRFKGTCARRNSADPPAAPHSPPPPPHTHTRTFPLTFPVLAQVGVMDMLRFHRFTIGHAWQTDYGDVEDAADFACLAAYSPLHNVARPADGGQYPAVMVTTGDHDDRVVPLHSHKLTATLQHVLATGADPPQRNPLLTRVQIRAGHGAGKPTDVVIAEVTDMYSFAAKAMGAAWVGPSQ